MPVEVKVPESGESITKVTIGRWYKKEGDFVAGGEKLLEIETDKVNSELTAPVAGKLVKLFKQEGEFAKVGEVVAVLDDTAKGAAAPPPSAAGKAPPTTNAPSSSTHVMPAAQRILAERNLSPENVQATGPGGRLLKEDVLRHDSRPPSNPNIQLPPASAQETRPATVAAPAPAPTIVGDRHEEVVEMTPLRSSVARRLVQAQQTAALVTTFNEIDMSAVMQMRKDVQDTFQKKHGVKLGFMSFFVKAAVDALRTTPQLNAEIRGDNIVYRNFYDVGVAVGGGKGLVVPIVRNAERLSFAEIEKQIAELAGRARENKLKMEELVGGTFTISNGGIFGSMLSTPIVNPPQSGILGLHAIQDRPVARDGVVVIRPMMYVALTYDHRIVDGRESVGFLVRIKECMENPARMLLEV